MRERERGMEGARGGREGEGGRKPCLLYIPLMNGDILIRLEA